MTALDLGARGCGVKIVEAILNHPNFVIPIDEEEEKGDKKEGEEGGEKKKEEGKDDSKAGGNKATATAFLQAVCEGRTGMVEMFLRNEVYMLGLFAFRQFHKAGMPEDCMHPGLNYKLLKHERVSA